MKARLPVVEEQALLVEDDPERLRSFAVGLLTQLRSIRSGGPRNGYPLVLIKKAAVRLIGNYADAGRPPDSEAVLLISELINPDPKASSSPVRPSSKRAYWSAIKFEASCSKPSRYAVAKHLRDEGLMPNASPKTTEGIVRDWQRMPHYKANVKLQRTGSKSKVLSGVKSRMAKPLE